MSSTLILLLVVRTRRFLVCRSGPSQITGDRATVEVRLRNFNKPVRFIYRLKHDADGWRIYDVATGGAQGLRRDLGLRD